MASLAPARSGGIGTFAINRPGRGGRRADSISSAADLDRITPRRQPSTKGRDRDLGPWLRGQMAVTV